MRCHNDAGHARCGCCEHATPFGKSHTSREKKYRNFPIFYAKYIVSFAGKSGFHIIRCGQIKQVCKLCTFIHSIIVNCFCAEFPIFRTLRRPFIVSPRIGII